MRYIPATKEQKKEMLKEIGVSSFEELIKSVPQSLQLKEKLNIPEAMSESELEDKIHHIANNNADFYSMKPLLGAGSYRHFIPEAVKFLLQREEFWTCYTPYQPELSQGTLQSIFEYQSYISRLTKMEVVIPSIYDAASATAEAALMSLRLTHKNKIIVSNLLHPHYKETVKTYLAPHQSEIIDLPYKNGLIDIEKLKTLLDENVTSVIIQSPNFFGGIENMAEISEIVHFKSILLINVITESMSLGILKAPGEMGADIVAGNAQSFGMDLNYGGPYNAYLATKKQYIRQLPGRIVGETVDVDGKRVFVMTMRAREQDIRYKERKSNF
jgi:glycine dehydrogenase subunit 1